MKRYKNSSNPKIKKQYKYKLKQQYTWDMIENLTITQAVLDKYFDKMEV